ncbi:uncharacterized protein LOC113515841 [Galleria mellonella]|uniref:Uncharacterized protein LOC113515841 n=1 Tax=Galleria mellonella TaxID=7137 RepID=A0ABM3MH73_GALME|nr:uncharacterized protein LOC113515841 [Galleria mellonella]
MKFTTILLLVAASYAAELRPSRNKQKEEPQEDKRRGVEGNAGVDKRAPVLSTVAPSVTPGIEYANTKEAQQDRSPAQQIYATPVPQIAKISDVLTGQGPPFQAAIASHLYAPVSIYQPRLGSPTIYEVSAPIPSQLAYSEHKLSYQPPQNALQYTPQTQYEQTAKILPLNQVNLQPVNHQQPYQQIFVQPQPIVYNHLAQPQQIYQQLPQLNFQPRLNIPQNEILRPIQYIQTPSSPITYLRQEPQASVSIVPPQQPLLLPAQPGITYLQKNNVAQNQPNVQTVLPTAIPRQAKEAEKAPEPQQNNIQQPQQSAQTNIPYLRTQNPISYTQPTPIAFTQPQGPIAYTQPQAPVFSQPQAPRFNQQQGAVSFASFSQSQPSSIIQQKSQQQQNQQPQYQTVQYQVPQNLQSKTAATENSASQSRVFQNKYHT